MFALIEASNEIWAFVAEKFEKRHSHSTFTCIFGAVEDKAFRELGTQQICQIWRSALRVHRHSDTNERVGDMFKNVLTY